MVRLPYKYDKKDFIRLYMNISYRNINDNVSRIVLLFLIVIFAKIFLELHKLFIFNNIEKIGYFLIYMFVIFVALFLIMIFCVIYLIAYKSATDCWERRRLIREKTCYIQSISFDIDCLIVDCVVLNKRIIKKIFYQELSVAKIYKNGLFLSIKGKLPLYVCKPLFNTEQEYEMVCKWINNLKIKKVKGSRTHNLER